MPIDRRSFLKSLAVASGAAAVPLGIEDVSAQALANPRRLATDWRAVR